ncbi:MAG: GNAT family N-acetyltransferase [Elusimicrobiaceae bacterium]|nr:GNAT family N-acetyltransferase [Elusimicrobiaceae bacterium]
MEEFHYKKFSGLNDDVVSLRTTVFMQEQGFKNEFDETDKTCVHVVLYDGDKPIATCRYFHEGTIYHIGRVAVLKAYRGQNLGHKMMQRAEAEIKKDGGHSIELSAQLRVKDFYKKLGYQEEGNVYLDEYCEHITMVKTI